MAQQTINVGAAPDDGTGDPLRTAFTKCNNNFAELYTADATHPPQGRLTLTSGAPVMIANATAQSTIYYAPYIGQMLPSFNGTATVMVDIGGEKSLALDSNSGHTGYHQNGKLFDVFWDDAGTRLVTGPAWTSDTARSAAIIRQNGFWTNSASMTARFDTSTSTVTIAANRGLYLGTFRATANGQTGMNFIPTAAAGGTNNVVGLYNAYNQESYFVLNRDSTASWSYAAATWRRMNNNANNTISYIDGLGDISVAGTLAVVVSCGAGDGIAIGVNRDIATGAPSIQAGIFNANSTSILARYGFFGALGFHALNAMEVSYATTSSILYGGGFGGGFGQVQEFTCELLI